MRIWSKSRRLSGRSDLFVAVLALVGASALASERPLVRRAHLVTTPQMEVTPEYARTLARVLIAIPEQDENAGVVDPRFARALHHDFLVSVPKYTEVGIIARAQDRDTILGWKHLFDSHDDIHLHFVREGGHEVDLWTQDLGEYVENESRPSFLVSMLPHAKMKTARAIALSRERVARTVFDIDAVVSANFVFEAGNLLFDETDTGPRVLVGEDVVSRSIASARFGGKTLRELQVADLISQQFGGAEVVVLRGEQGGGLIHIDQAFVLLRGGKVILNSIVSGRSTERALLDGYRKQLEWIGYDVVALETSVEDVRSFRASTNALPFTHLRTGEDSVLFPVFPGEVEPGAPAKLRREHLRGKAAAAYRVFEEAGYDPIPIRDLAHVAGGNTHCIVNALY